MSQPTGTPWNTSEPEGRPVSDTPDWQQSETAAIAQQAGFSLGPPALETADEEGDAAPDEAVVAVEAETPSPEPDAPTFESEGASAGEASWEAEPSWEAEASGRDAGEWVDHDEAGWDADDSAPVVLEAAEPRADLRSAELMAWEATFRSAVTLTETPAEPEAGALAEGEESPEGEPVPAEDEEASAETTSDAETADPDTSTPAYAGASDEALAYAWVVEEAPDATAAQAVEGESEVEPDLSAVTEGDAMSGEGSEGGTEPATEQIPSWYAEGLSVDPQYDVAAAEAEAEAKAEAEEEAATADEPAAEEELEVATADDSTDAHDDVAESTLEAGAAAGELGTDTVAEAADATEAAAASDDAATETDAASDEPEGEAAAELSAEEREARARALAAAWIPSSAPVTSGTASSVFGSPAPWSAEATTEAEVAEEDEVATVDPDSTEADGAVAAADAEAAADGDASLEAAEPEPEPEPEPVEIALFDDNAERWWEDSPGTAETDGADGTAVATAEAASGAEAADTTQPAESTGEAGAPSGVWAAAWQWPGITADQDEVAPPAESLAPTVSLEEEEAWPPAPQLNAPAEPIPGTGFAAGRVPAPDTTDEAPGSLARAFSVLSATPDAATSRRPVALGGTDDAAAGEEKTIDLGAFGSAPVSMTPEAQLRAQYRQRAASAAPGSTQAPNGLWLLTGEPGAEGERSSASQPSLLVNVVLIGFAVLVVIVILFGFLTLATDIF